MLPADLTRVEYAFWLCAFGGTLFFILRVMLVVVGGFGAHDFGTGDHDLSNIHTDGMGAHDADSTHDGHDSDAAFKLLSLNSISAFIMMFGWAGLAASRQHHFGGFVSLLCAVAVGFLMMVLTSYLFVLARKFTTEGADFRIEQVIGQTAKVYMRIPQGGRGKIHITLNGLLRELDAESDYAGPIESFTSVTISEAVGSSVVKVKPLKTENA